MTIPLHNLGYSNVHSPSKEFTMENKIGISNETGPEMSFGGAEQGLENHKTAEMNYSKVRQHNFEAVKLLESGNHEKAWENVLIAERYYALAIEFLKKFTPFDSSRVYSL